MKNLAIRLLLAKTLEYLFIGMVFFPSLVFSQASSIPDSLYAEIVSLKKQPVSSARNEDILTLFFELTSHYHPRAKGNWIDSLYIHTRLYDSGYGINLSGLTRADILCQEGKFKEGTEHFLFSIKQLEKTGHYAQAAFGYLRLGAAVGIMQQNGNEKIDFLGYYNKGLSLANKSNQPAYQVLALGYFASWHYNNRNFKETLKTGNQMLSIIERDKSRSSSQHLSGAYRFIGFGYLGLEDVIKAERYLKLAKLWTRSPGRGLYLNYSIHKALTEFYFKQEDYGKALTGWDSSMVALTNWKSELKLADADKYFADLYLLKYKIFKESNRMDSALLYHEKLLDQKSVNIQNELDKNYSELHEKYQVEAKELEITKLNNEVLENQSDKQRLVIYFLVAFLALLGILSGLIFRSLRLNQKNIKYAVELMTVKNELSTKVIQAQETERRRLAKDLHDDLGGTLSAIKGQAANEHVSKQTLNLIEKAIEDLRGVSRNLMPPELEKAGLAGSVHQAVERLRKISKTEFIFITFGREVHLNADAELNIYRIIGELLNNILKHAKASKGVVQLLYYDDYLLVSVEDNGRGIKTEEKNWGIGLKNINSRVEYLKAELSIDTGPLGTTVIIKMPY